MEFFLHDMKNLVDWLFGYCCIILLLLWNYL